METRSVTIQFRVSEKEKAEIEKASKDIGLKAGSFCRMASLEKARK